MSDEPQPVETPIKELSISAFKVRVRNLLIEFGLDTFAIQGFRGQDDFEMSCFRGARDLRALNDLFKEVYRTNFEDLPEYEATWEEWDGDDD